MSRRIATPEAETASLPTDPTENERARKLDLNNQVQVVAAAEAILKVTEDEDEWLKAFAAVETGKRKIDPMRRAYEIAAEANKVDKRRRAAHEIPETLAPLDAAIFDALDRAAEALAEVGNASRHRDQAVAIERERITSLGTGDGISGGPYPTAGGYRLTGTKAEVATELATISEPIWSSLGERFIANELTSRRTAGNRLRRPQPEDTNEKVSL